MREGEEVKKKRKPALPNCAVHEGAHNGMANVHCQLDRICNHFRDKLLSMLSHQVRLSEMRRPTLVVCGTMGHDAGLS